MMRNSPRKLKPRPAAGRGSCERATRLAEPLHDGADRRRVRILDLRVVLVRRVEHLGDALQRLVSLFASSCQRTINCWKAEAAWPFQLEATGSRLLMSERSSWPISSLTWLTCCAAFCITAGSVPKEPAIFTIPVKSGKPVL